MACFQLTEGHLMILAKVTPDWRSIVSPQMAEIFRELASVHLVEWDTSVREHFGDELAEGRVRLAPDGETTLSDLLELADFADGAPAAETVQGAG
jgi:hypothetical protein